MPTTLFDPSPYGSALLSKYSVLDRARHAVGRSCLGSACARASSIPWWASRPAGPANRVQLAYAWKASRGMLAALHARFRQVGGSAGNQRRGPDRTVL